MRLRRYKGGGREEGRKGEDGRRVRGERARHVPASDRGEEGREGGMDGWMADLQKEEVHEVGGHVGRPGVEVKEAMEVPLGIRTYDSSRLGYRKGEEEEEGEEEEKEEEEEEEEEEEVGIGGRVREGRWSVEAAQIPLPPSLPPSLLLFLSPSSTIVTYMHNRRVAPYLFLLPCLEQKEADLRGVGEVEGMEEAVGQELG